MRREELIECWVEAFDLAEPGIGLLGVRTLNLRRLVGSMPVGNLVELFRGPELPGCGEAECDEHFCGHTNNVPLIQWIE